MVTAWHVKGANRMYTKATRLREDLWCMRCSRFCVLGTSNLPIVLPSIRVDPDGDRDIAIITRIRVLRRWAQEQTKTAVQDRVSKINMRKRCLSPSCCILRDAARRRACCKEHTHTHTHTNIAVWSIASFNDQQQCQKFSIFQCAKFGMDALTSGTALQLSLVQCTDGLSSVCTMQFVISPLISHSPQGKQLNHAIQVMVATGLHNIGWWKQPTQHVLINGQNARPITRIAKRGNSVRHGFLGPIEISRNDHKIRLTHCDRPFLSFSHFLYLTGTKIPSRTSHMFKYHQVNNFDVMHSGDEQFTGLISEARLSASCRLRCLLSIHTLSAPSHSFLLLFHRFLLGKFVADSFWRIRR